MLGFDAIQTPINWSWREQQ